MAAVHSVPASCVRGSIQAWYNLPDAPRRARGCLVFRAVLRARQQFDDDDPAVDRGESPRDIRDAWSGMWGVISSMAEWLRSRRSGRPTVRGRRVGRAFEHEVL